MTTTNTVSLHFLLSRSFVPQDDSKVGLNEKDELLYKAQQSWLQHFSLTCVYSTTGTPTKAKMRKLTIEDDLREIKSVEDIISFSQEKNIQFPAYFIEFMLNYEGSTLKEYVFRHTSGDGWSTINQILSLRKNQFSFSIEDYLEIFTKEMRCFIPFANDPGGWLFYISLESETKEQVWIISNSAQKKMIASDLSEFINGLMTYEEAASKGY